MAQISGAFAPVPMTEAVFSAMMVSFETTSRLPGRARASLPEHGAILDAIRSHQVRRAGRAMRHLVEGAAREIEVLRKSERP